MRRQRNRHVVVRLTSTEPLPVGADSPLRPLLQHVAEALIHEWRARGCPRQSFDRRTANEPPN
jgi:hypothetical protein